MNWHVPTRVEMTLDVDRVSFSVAGDEPVPILARAASFKRLALEQLAKVGLKAQFTNGAIAEIVARPQTVAAWRQQGAEPMRMPPAEFEAFLHKDIEKWADLIKKADIKVQR